MPSDGGKGSAPRPFSVDQKTYEENWDRIFKKHEEVKGTVVKLKKDLDNNKNKNTDTGG